MKSLKTAGVLMILLFAFGLQAQGQRFLSSWEEYTFGGDGADSAEFAYYLGSVEEFNYQVARAYDEEYRAERIQFIDAKYAYVIWFVSYVSDIGVCSNSVSYKEMTDRIVFSLRGCKVGSEVYPVIVDLKLNKDMRIQKADITGRPQHLIKIFKHQWNVSEDDILGIHKGEKITIYRLDESVTFDWTGENPIILIRGNSAKNYKKRIEGK